MKNKNTEKIEFLKIVYFDEAAAQDYVDVTNGGRLDWSTQENKEKIAKIVAEIEAQAKSGFNILNYIKATFQGKVDASASAELTSAFDKTIKNTLLTDYIQAASKDEHVKKFENSGVYAPENSVTLYKMLSSYLTIVPKEEMPIDMEKLNEAILGERGYYDMLLKTEIERKSVLRFNLQAFKNNYNLVDLSKMKLTYFGIKVGTCGENHLSIDKEFDFQPAEDKTTAEEIVEGEKSAAEEEKELDSAFYQLFDEGIYEDHNYKVVVNKAIIMCTSNYKTIDEIKEHLGLPIYNRFDSIIKFNDLSGMAKEKIAEREIERLREDYDIEDRELFDKIKKGAVTQSNAREIKHLIKDTFSLVALNKICGETEI